MENASKALIMVGGVLIAILVASLGVYISKTVAEYIESNYRRLEQPKITEFNQQFLQYNDSEVNMQDIVTMINLAKNNNIKYNFTKDDAPNVPKNDGSYYITVDIEAINAGAFATIPDDKKYMLKHIELLTDDEINTLLVKEMSNEPLSYKCKVNINEKTKYVNEIIISI